LIVFSQNILTVIREIIENTYYFDIWHYIDDITEWKKAHKTHTHKKKQKKPTLNNRLKKHAKQNCHYNYFYFWCGIQLLKQENSKSV
jgi:hypothetical protein